MDQGPAPETARWSLRSRGPAHAVSHRCLELQREARPRGWLARLLGLDPLHPDAVSWYRGALGELRVGRLLAGLGPGWRVLHAVPHGDHGADIDHLVIGPAGVFTINTKNHTGRRVWVGGAALHVDGQRTSHIPAAEREAGAASRFLTRAIGARVTATPLVVVVDPAELRHGDTPSPVPVLTAARVVRHLRALPSRLEADVVATISRAAEEWTTWRPFGVDLPSHTDPDDAFARLRREVERARRHRVLWALTGLVALPLAVIGVASGLLG